MKSSLQFSYSKMSLYKECPQKFKFKYIDKMPEQPKTYFAFGSSIHKALEFFHDPVHKASPSLQELVQAFQTDWMRLDATSKGYASQCASDEALAVGIEMLKNYYAKHREPFTPPLSVEFRTRVTIDDLIITAIVDRVDHLGDGKLRVVDYKTGKNVSREPDQLYMYQKVLESSKAFAELTSGIPGKKTITEMAYYHVPSLTEVVVPRAKPNELEYFWEKALMVGENIRACKFDPTPSFSCKFCDYRSACDALRTTKFTKPQAEPEAEPASLQPDPTSGLLAGEVVVPVNSPELDIVTETLGIIDDAMDLAERAKALRSRIEGLK